MTQVLGLSSTAIAVLATPLQYQAIQRKQIAELANTKKFRFNNSFDRGNEKRTAMVAEEPTTNQWKNLDKVINPNNNMKR